MSPSRLGRLRVVRVVAVAIAVLAAIDPGCVRTRRDRPLVSVIAGATVADSARAQVIEGTLGDRYDMVAGWLPSADAMVVTGDRLPVSIRREAPSVPVFILPPAGLTPDVRVHALRSPARARRGERVVIDAYVAYAAVAGDSLALTVRRDGLLLAQQLVPVAASRGERRQMLAIVASDTGAMALEVTAALTRSDVHARQGVVIAVHDAPMRVLSHDTRPTWFGTFMRRALLADARFDVTSRTTISRTNEAPITLSEGAPPALASLPTPGALDVVVIGAANALDDRAMDALDRWVRSGGSAVLLLDEVPSARVQRWIGVPGWRRVDQATAQAAQFTNVFGTVNTAIDGPPADSAPPAAPLLGRQWLVPTRLSAGDEPWMQLADASPVVWSHRVGAGTLIVSGALDAWTFREGTRSDFAGTWPRVVAEAAARVAPAVSMVVRPAVATAGAWREVDVSTQHAEPDSVASAYALTLIGPANVMRQEPQRLTLYPRGDGRWGAAWRDTTGDPGTRQLVVSLSGQPLATAPAHTVIGGIGSDAPHPSVLTALALATGGRVVDTDDVDTLGDALELALSPATRQQPWHPMRSPLWLLPFSGALLIEWWLRRRAGQP